MVSIKRAFVAVMVLSLGACETLAPVSSVSPENRMGTTISAPTNTPEVALAPFPVEPTYIPSTDELLGMDKDSTEVLLGAASLQRAEQNGEIWQYRTEACVLFLFFYADENDVSRISYLTSSATHAGDTSPGDQPCVDAVTRAAVNAATS